MGEAATDLTRVDSTGDLADANQPGCHHWVRTERTARRIDAHIFAKTERTPKHNLVVAELCVQLGDIEPALERARLFARRSGRGAGREVTDPDVGRVDPVVDPANQCRP